MRGFATIITLLLLTVARMAFGQGFINLDFESAKIIPIVNSPIYPYGITTANALPGWTAYIGTNQQSAIAYNNPALGSTWINLWATNGGNINGNYSVFLQGGISATDASISQTGLVPTTANSLTFVTFYSTDTTTLQVSLGGQNLPYYVISQAGTYATYGADISAFAGQVKALTFSALGFSGRSANWNIDDIQFSAQVIPEPSVAWLVLAGGAGLFFVRRKGV